MYVHPPGLLRAAMMAKRGPDPVHRFTRERELAEWRLTTASVPQPAAATAGLGDGGLLAKAPEQAVGTVQMVCTTQWDPPPDGVGAQRCISLWVGDKVGCPPPKK